MGLMRQITVRRIFAQNKICVLLTVSKPLRLSLEHAHESYSVFSLNKKHPKIRISRLWRTNYETKLNTAQMQRLAHRKQQILFWAKIFNLSENSSHCNLLRKSHAYNKKISLIKKL